MKSDSDIRRNVEAELQWDPQVDQTDIAVKVSGGAVTLSGYARNYLERYQAEQTAKRVAGVLAVANDIQVRASGTAKSSDPEIARQCITELQYELPHEWEKLKVLVDGGHVRLEGDLEWNYQRERAEAAVRRVKGVLTLRDHIALVPGVAASDVKRKIEEAFRRNAQVDAGHIVVETQGSEVILSGEVRSWSEREQAQQSAWFAPGVTTVTNNLRVIP